MTPSPSIYRPENQCGMDANTPRWSEGPTRSHHMEAPEWRPQGRFGRPVGSADPLWAPLGVCFLQVAVLWVLRSLPCVHVFLRRFRRSDGPMDPCEVHVSCSDSSGLASLGLVTCLACMASEVATPPWLRWCDMNHIRYATSFALIFLQPQDLQGQVKLHYS
jgi:hypothetical protein